MEHMFITNQPLIARILDDVGVERVWVDLEKIGKEKRQKNYDSVKSKHEIQDIIRIKPILKQSKLQVRINPINQDSADEIERVIDAGADLIMLPYYKTLGEIEQFLRYVNNRATTILLLETKEADELLYETLQYNEIDEIHIGLNDLHLSYRKKFMFELLADGTVERICQEISKKGKPFGFGGIACLGKGIIPAELILAEHVRLNSTRVILSRSFYQWDYDLSEENVRRTLNERFRALKKCEEQLEKENEEFFVKNKMMLSKCINEIA